MKTGWLVYRPDEIARNQRFIDKWMNASNKRNIQIFLITTDMLNYGMISGKAFVRSSQTDRTPDFAVIRLNDPLLTETFEKAGIPTFNNSRVAYICNDKRRTHLLFNNRLPMMDTAFLSDCSGRPPFPYPFVLKAVHNCGGRKVFLCSDINTFQSAVAACLPDSMLAQPLCDTPGQDVRVYVVGKRVITAMKRFSTDGDFRSNLQQGGNATTWTMDAQIKNYVDIVMKEFDFGLVGIDFIFHKGQLMFNEIEDAVGTRMLYIHTQLDIVDIYLDHILTRIADDTIG